MTTTTTKKGEVWNQISNEQITWKVLTGSIERQHGRVKKTFKLGKRFDSLNLLLQISPIALPWEGVIFNFSRQIPLLSSYHVLSPPQEMGEQAFHTTGAIHFWADLPATVVSGIHASRDKSACQYKSHVYIGHKLVPALFFFFGLPFHPYSMELSH